MTDERCRICGEVLHPTQDGFYVAVNGCSVCHGKLWTPAELALARATAAARVAEAVKPLWSVLNRHYPKIAGHVIGLEQSGETVAHERWAALARDFYNAEIAARALLDKAGS